MGHLARAREMLLDRVLNGDWWPRLARPLGMQGRFELARHVFDLTPPGVAAGTLRVGFISDLHAGPSTHQELIAEALDSLAAERPDVLLLGGDYISFHARHLQRVLARIAGMIPPLGAFAVLGNHDLMGDDVWITRQLEDIGVNVLVNRSMRLPAPWAHVFVCGLDDPGEGRPDADAATHGAEGERLLLVHAPDGLMAMGDRPFTVGFCGHTHGGQVLLPGGFAVVRPGGPMNVPMRCGGVFGVGPDGDRPLVVSRGIGCSTLPIRWGANPQAHIVELRLPAWRSSRTTA